MAYTCDYCHKGRVFGHAVSHAKNRIARAFIPNLQRLKVLKNGALMRVRWCTSCIKRLKKDGNRGPFYLKKPGGVAVSLELPKGISQKEKEKKVVVKAQEKAKEALQIESIVGKKG